jgi:site-specific DNA recombinase
VPPFESSPLPACDLLRVSKDRQGREKSPEDQHELNQRTCTRENWRIVRTYSDIGSASRTARKTRAGFERLIADLKAGTFPGRLLLMYENSRGSRQEHEWVELINLAEKRSIKFWIEVRNRLMDPADPHDRRDLVHAAADAAYETGLLSLRVRRGTQSAVVAGLPHGQTPYGFVRRYDERTKQLIEQQHHPDEAPVVRELFERVAEGQSIYRIARDFEERGIEKRSGGPFSQPGLRSMLNTAAYAGLRVHNTEWRVRSRPGPDAQTTEAVWKPIVDERLFARVQRILRAPDRKKFRGGSAVHWLARIAHCDKCGAVVSVRRGRKGELRYACDGPSGCVSILRDDLDVWTERLLLTWLADPERYRVLAQAGADADAELERVRDDLAAEVEERAQLADKVAKKVPGFTLEFAAPIAAAIEERIARLQLREKELEPSVLDGVLEPGPDVAERWKVLEIDSRRYVARQLLVPKYIGELRIKPIGRGNRGVPVKDRVFLAR